MHRLLYILCAISVINAALLSPDDLNLEEKNGTTPAIVHNPTAPFARFGVVYYWSGHYKYAPSTPKKCIFLRNHPDWPFGESQHPNGTSMTGVEFGCRNDDLCRKYRCDKSMASGLVWCAFLLISSIISIGIIIRYIIGRKPEEERTEQDMEMRSVYVPVVVVNRQSTGHLEVPQLYPI